MNIEEEMAKFDLVKLEFESTCEKPWWASIKDSSVGERYYFTGDDIGETAEEALWKAIQSIAKGINRVK